MTAFGCATRPVRDKLESAGLELVDERVARVPARERGRYLPCRVVPGAREPALDPHAAGYLIVGVDGREAESASEIFEALEEWSAVEQPMAVHALCINVLHRRQVGHWAHQRQTTGDCAINKK